MYLIRRVGNFNVRLQPDSNHCGMKEGMNNFDYEVEINVADGYLDSRGFIIDNADIDHYFQTIETTGLSCELLSREAAFYFWKKLKTNPYAPGDEIFRSKQIIRIWIRIWGLPDAACIDYVFDRRAGDEPLTSENPFVKGKKIAPLKTAWGYDNDFWNRPPKKRK